MLERELKLNKSYYEERLERKRRRNKGKGGVANAEKDTVKPAKIMTEQATEKEYIPVPAICPFSSSNIEASLESLDTTTPNFSKPTIQFYVPKIELQNILECQKADIELNTAIPEVKWTLNVPVIELPKLYFTCSLPSFDESLKLQKAMMEVPRIVLYALHCEEDNSISTKIAQIAIKEPRIPEVTLETLKVVSRENLKEEIPTDNWSVEIPKLILSELKITLYESIDLSVPKIERKPLDIPKFRFFTPQLMFLNEKLELRYSTGVRTGRLLIPKLKFRRPVIEFLEGKLDCSMIRGEVLRVPELKLKQKLNVVPTEVEINSTVSLELMESVRVELSPEHVWRVHEEVLEREKVTPQEKTDTVASSESGGGEELELEDPFEKLFGEGAGKVRDVEPLVILFKDYEDDSYIQTFEVLLYRLYREKAGGKPSVKSLSLRKAWSIKEIEQWLDEGKSVKKIRFDEGGEDLDATELSNRLDAMFSEGVGIVILYAKNEKKFKEIESKISSICATLEGKPEIVKIKTSRLSLQEKIKFVQLLFGNVDISEGDLIRASATSKKVKISNGKPVVEVSMDTVLNIAMKKYKQKLLKLVERYDIIGLINSAEDESPEHYEGKTFIVNYLIRNLQAEELLPKHFDEIPWDEVEEKFIKTETPMNEKIIPDVIFLPKSEYYEFETLFGEGFRKITKKTLKKYHENLKGARVRIVVEPITAFIHAKEFKELIRLIKRKQRFRELDIGFYTFDSKNEKLMPLEDYLKELNIWLSKMRK